jgi:hypothetical protein
MNTRSMEKILEDENMVVDMRNAHRDLIILKYMAWRLHAICYQLHQSEEQETKQFHRIQERGGRSHRIVIYQQQELLQQRSFPFVGFISKRKKELQSQVVEAIQQTDAQLVPELVDIPGVLSYSSMQLLGDDWCNLVILDDIRAKTHIKSSQTHQHAAHNLAHGYYEWIRLHSGTMPAGLDPTEMQLLSTKYYIFHPGQQRPSLRERTYGSSQVQAINTWSVQ